MSDVQVALNERHVREAGCEDHVEARFVLDVRETPRLGEGLFDAVVAYGGPLSYVFDDAESVFARWAREGKLSAVVTPGGHRRYTLAVVLAFLSEMGLDEQAARNAVHAVS